MLNREKIRICLGCRKNFNSSSAANRFCKNCKKKRRQLYGGLEAIVMPAHVKLTEHVENVQPEPVYRRRRHSRSAR